MFLWVLEYQFEKNKSHSISRLQSSGCRVYISTYRIVPWPCVFNWLVDLSKCYASNILKNTITLGLSHSCYCKPWDHDRQKPRLALCKWEIMWKDLDIHVLPTIQLRTQTMRTTRKVHRTLQNHKYKHILFEVARP